MKNYKWMLLLCVCLSTLTGCNNTDDVQKIFTGKTWRLNYITQKNGHEMFNFWGNNEAARVESMKLLSNPRNYQINFSGATTDDIINGNISGTVVMAKINGTWSANARNQKFNAAVKADVTEKDVLAQRFIELLNSVDSYSGDEHNLYLYYENLSMVFYVVPSNN